MVAGRQADGWVGGGSRGTEAGIVVGLRTLKRAFVKQASN